MRLKKNTIPFLFLGFFLMPCVVDAQVSQSLSVTPPLFELSILPGDVWQSQVKVLNNNPYELTVYADVVNFAPVGEDGQGKFIPILDDPSLGKKVTLAEWIEVSDAPFTIEPEQARDIPFFVDIPVDAAPGGHFAAILISTEPPPRDGVVAVRTSQVVTSLFFVRVDGDITEAGSIREFAVTDGIVPTPETNFKLRFENKGNVHLQPRGDILITNMWGKERGTIPINNQTNFGNVLPDSIREFNFSWKGEPSLADIGRYKAIVTLAFGEDGIQNVTATTYFYVVPIKATLITLLALVLSIAFMTWIIRSYVRRMLMLAGIDPSLAKTAPRASRLTELDKDVRVSSYKAITAPLRAGASEFKEKLSAARRAGNIRSALISFVLSYKIFFVGIGGLVIVASIATLFFIDVLEGQRNYEVTIDKGDTEVTVNSEEILKERIGGEQKVVTREEQGYELVLINASDVPGQGAAVALMLEKQSYFVTTLEADSSTPRERTVIIYDAELLATAEALSKILDGALLSARPPVPSDEENPDTFPTITIMVGRDSIE